MAVLTEEQTMLRDAAKGWTSESAPVGALRKLRDGKLQAELRRRRLEARWARWAGPA
jgi:hypothetical protein